MTLYTIALNNLRRRKGRLIFLVLGLLVGIATVVALISLTAALTKEAEHKLDQFGANIIVTPRTDDLSISYGGITLGGISVAYEPIREQDVALIFTIPERRSIAAVAPKILGAIRYAEQQVVMMGVDRQVEFELKRWWQIEGRFPEADYELIVGWEAARRLGLEVGQIIDLKGQAFTLTGILQPTGSPEDRMLIGSLAPIQHLLNRSGEISLIEVAALCAYCPIEEVVQQIHEVLPYAQVTALQQVVKSRMHAMEQFVLLSYGVAGVVIFIGGLVVLITMMGSVNERTREIGIFRALGFRRRHVMELILLEAATISLISGLMGYLTGMGVTQAVLPWLAQEHPHLEWDLFLLGNAALLAVTVGCLATIYPAWQASRMDPAEALRAL